MVTTEILEKRVVRPKVETETRRLFAYRQSWPDHAAATARHIRSLCDADTEVIVKKKKKRTLRDIDFSSKNTWFRQLLQVCEWRVTGLKSRWQWCPGSNYNTTQDLWRRAKSRDNNNNRNKREHMKKLMLLGVLVLFGMASCQYECEGYRTGSLNIFTPSKKASFRIDREQDAKPLTDNKQD